MIENKNYKEFSNIETLMCHEDKIWQISFHPLEDILASCSSDRNICIWEKSNKENLENKFSLKSILEDSHSRTIRSVSWDKSGNYLASASFDSMINIWKKYDKKFECIATLEGHENEVKSVSWSVTGNYLASCSRDKSIWIWDIEDDNDFSCNTILQGHTQDVKMVKWSTIEDVLFSASYDNTIKVWRHDPNEEDWICINTLTDHISTVWCIDVTNDGKFLISVSDDRSIILWKFEDKNYSKISKITKISQLHDRTIYSCCINFNDKLIATSSSDNSIKILELNLEYANEKSEENRSKCLRELETKYLAHEEDINFVTFHPKKNILASCADDNLIKIWEN